MHIVLRVLLRLDDFRRGNYLTTSRMQWNELPIESLVKLSLFKDSPLSQKRAGRWNLRGSELKLDKVMMNGVNAFEEVPLMLNLNAVNLTIVTEAAFSTLVVRKLNRVIANRTKNFSLLLSLPNTLGNFPHKQLRAFVDYVLTSCSGLKKLFVQIFEGSKPSLNLGTFVQWIMELTELLKAGPLMKLKTRGCELIIGVPSFFSKQLLMDVIDSDHEVTKIGEPCDTEWMEGGPPAMIARQVKLKEKFYVRYLFIADPYSGCCVG